MIFSWKLQLIGNKLTEQHPDNIELESSYPKYEANPIASLDGSYVIVPSETGLVPATPTNT